MGTTRERRVAIIVFLTVGLVALGGIPAGGMIAGASSVDQVVASPGTTTAPIPGEIGSTAEEASPDTSEVPIVVSYDVDFRPNEPDRIALLIEVTFPDEYDGSESLRVIVEAENPELTVYENDGFSVFNGSSGFTLTISEERETASIELSYDPRTTWIRGGDEFTVDDDWAFLGLSTNYPDRWEVDEEISPGGVIGDRHTFMGDYEKFTHEVADKEFTVVFAEAASFQDDPETVFESLVWQAERLRVGDRNDAVLGFGVPREVGGGLAWHAESEFYVAAHRSSLAANVWGHEYMHLRQGPHDRASARWLREAEPTYFQYLYAYKRGDRSFSDLQRSLASGTNEEDVTLNEPGTWGPYSNYWKGSLVIGALDAEIRERTDGERTYEDVWRERNTRGSIDHDEFVDALETVVGEPMDDFVESYVNGTEIPDVPDDPLLYQADQPDLDVTYAMTTDVEVLAVGQERTIVVEISNEGDDPGIGVTNELALPESWKLVDSHGGESTPDGVRWTTMELAPNATVEREVTVKVPGNASVGAESLSVRTVDSDGNDLVETVTVTVEDIDPPIASVTNHLMADINGEQVIVGRMGDGITLDASESQSEAEIVEYRWTIDGNELSQQTDSTLTVGDDRPGRMSVSLTVVDEFGQEDTFDIPLVINDVPSVEIIGHDDAVPAGVPVEFEADVTNELGDYEVRWELPDGSTASGQVIEFEPGPGTHEVRVDVEDGFGETATDIIEVTVPQPPSVEVTVHTERATTDDYVTLTASVDQPSEIHWELPDGTIVSGDRLSHHFESGEHNVTAVAVDEFGIERTETVTVEVMESPADSTDASDMLPGFTVVPAAVALVGSAVVVRRRGRRTSG